MDEIVGRKDAELRDCPRPDAKEDVYRIARIRGTECAHDADILSVFEPEALSAREDMVVGGGGR